MDNLIELLPLIFSALAMLGSGIAWLNNAGKRKADETSVITGSAINLVQELQEQMQIQARKIAELQVMLKDEQEKRRLVENRVSMLERENARLIFENRDLQAENELLKAKKNFE